MLCTLINYTQLYHTLLSIPLQNNIQFYNATRLVKGLALPEAVNDKGREGT